jgi:hypothetical protein
MGKDRSHQRVKGNTQPSSSSSAQLNTSGFLGFSSFNHEDLAAKLDEIPAGGPIQYVNQHIGGDPTPIIFPVNGATLVEKLLSHASNPAVPSNLSLILRKLAKRDSNTKIKGLEDLMSYCNNEVDIENVLPIWPIILSRLFNDLNKRIRLLTLTIHSEVIIGKCGKKVARYLKDLSPAWILSRFDKDLEVRQVANRSWDTCFKVEERRIAVLKHCWEQISEQLTFLVLVATPESLSDPRFQSTDEMNETYCRTVTSAISSISLMLSTYFILNCCYRILVCV